MSKGLKELNKIKKLNILYDIEMTESGEEYMKENDIDLSLIEKDLKALKILIYWYKPNIIEDLYCLGASDKEINLVRKVMKR